MDAYDSNVPDNRATIQVVINVLRNPGAPSFDQPSYFRLVDELHALAVPVLNITASDPENVRSIFSNIGMVLFLHLLNAQ